MACIVREIHALVFDRKHFLLKSKVDKYCYTCPLDLMVVEKLVTRMVVKTLLTIGRSTEGEKPAKMLLLFVMSS